MYIAKNKLLGHGSGIGPTQKNLKDYCAGRFKSGKGLIKVLRVVEPDAPDESFGQRVLSYGASGADVRTLQSVLISLGYACGRWGADGEFGEATRSAVSAFQYDWHIEADGVVGKHTYIALNAALKELSDPPLAEDAAEEGGKIAVTGGASYVRDQPGQQGRILGVVKTGDVLPYLNETTKSGWHAVAFAGERAWHSGRYGKVVGA
jgi:peptidoglycan hydrolase-like protein with peptidoglycan-binding domain